MHEDRTSRNGNLNECNVTAPLWTGKPVERARTAAQTVRTAFLIFLPFILSFTLSLTRISIVRIWSVYKELKERLSKRHGQWIKSHIFSWESHLQTLATSHFSRVCGGSLQTYMFQLFMIQRNHSYFLHLFARPLCAFFIRTFFFSFSFHLPSSVREWFTSLSSGAETTASAHESVSSFFSSTQMLFFIHIAWVTQVNAHGWFDCRSDVQKDLSKRQLDCEGSILMCKKQIKDGTRARKRWTDESMVFLSSICNRDEWLSWSSEETVQLFSQQDFFERRELLSHKSFYALDHRLKDKWISRRKARRVRECV